MTYAVVYIGFPAGTLVVNLARCFAIGVVTSRGEGQRTPRAPGPPPSSSPSIV